MFVFYSLILSFFTRKCIIQSISSIHPSTYFIVTWSYSNQGLRNLITQFIDIEEGGIVIVSLVISLLTLYLMVANHEMSIHSTPVAAAAFVHMYST